ncbi:MAG: DUF4381 domain-containing protein [Methylococcales bacterium]|jgi:hypothetical protein|nr:DUF4381 domain-containing protein [Methylococcales bacterium]MBT7444695.1 DUF4381 domain-containing protein [Methylococcales bacterium]
MDLQLLLNGLREIQVPETVSIWPLAPVWWISLFLIIALISRSAFKRRPVKNPAVDLALDQLNLLRKQYRDHQSTSQSCIDLSQLLRQMALSLAPRDQVAQLTGQPWLQWLDQQANMQEFSSGIGQIMLSAPYQANPDINIHPLFKLIRRWIKQTQGKPKHD